MAAFFPPRNPIYVFIISCIAGVFRTWDIRAVLRQFTGSVLFYLTYHNTCVGCGCTTCAQYFKTSCETTQYKYILH